MISGNLFADSFESMLSNVRNALKDVFPSKNGYNPCPCLEATYPDYVLVTAYDYSNGPSADAPTPQVLYKVPYSIDDEGAIEFDEPVPVTLDVAEIGESLFDRDAGEQIGVPSLYNALRHRDMLLHFFKSIM